MSILTDSGRSRSRGPGLNLAARPAELFVDTPWHTPQPFAEPFDIEAPVEAILERTEALCRSRPGFLPRAEWRTAQVERMGDSRCH